MSSDTQRPIKILHAFGRMGRGGAETWIMNVLRRIDRERVRFDFLVHRPEPGELDDEIRSLGSSIHVVESYRNPARYPIELGVVLERERYDVVHSHVSFYSGYILLCARLAGVRGRIAHSHTSVPADRDSALRAMYKRAMRSSLHLNATRGLGASAIACEALYGPEWRARGKYEVLLYGYDFGRFAAVDEEARAAGRAALGLAAGDFAVGHIGRFVVPKNHEFIVELAAASQARGRGAERFVLVGDGELRPEIERAVHQRGLAGKVMFTGQRSDVPELLSAFDAVIVPSLWEGLCVAAVEAQAAGVPCIVSDRVPGEATVLADRVMARPLDVAAWLDALDAARAAPPLARERALEAMNASPFGIERHLARLVEIYGEEAAHPGAAGDVL